METIDQILAAIEQTPYLGAESEGQVIDPSTFETHHTIGGTQPTQAVKDWLKAAGVDADTLSFITPDVPETTTEVNPPPLRSPRSTAMAQRLFTILVDTAHQVMREETGTPIQLLHGAALRPPHITPEDASRHIDPFKQLYYEFQIGNHGDKVGAATGDHYNISAPWKKFRNPQEATDFYVRMAGHMRLIGASLMMGLGTASPLYSASKNGGHGTVLTGTNSNRLSRVWPGRTILDMANLFSNRQTFLSELHSALDDRLLYTGRDIWLPTRPQAAPIHAGKSFQQICEECGIDLDTPEGMGTARKILAESFTLQEGDPSGTKNYRPVKNWRLEMVQKFIEAPRNRVEMRVTETPPAFEGQTPYQTIKALHTFQELLFIYLTRNPEWAQRLRYSCTELPAAKHNEESILKNGLDGKTYWPHNRRETTGRAMLKTILDDPEFKKLVEALNRTEDMEWIRQVAESTTKPPAERMRDEIAAEYGINADHNETDRFLHGEDPDRYPRELLRRTRAAMPLELQQIETDLLTVPKADQPALRTLLNTVKKIRERLIPALAA